MRDGLRQLSRWLPRWLLGAVFVVAGVLHLVVPDVYLVAMPPALPAPRALICVSGVAEIAGGVGLWLPSLRWCRRAGIGLVLLLVAVYPANLHMAMAGVGGPSWALWARLPVQGLLIAWALRSSGALAYSSTRNSPGQASRASDRSEGA